MSVTTKGTVNAGKRVSVSNEVKLDRKFPIPFEVTGSSFFHYEAGQPYIPFLGSKNDFFNTLFEARLLSPTHNACINTKKSYCIGNGLHVREAKEKTLKEYDINLYNFLKLINNRGQSMNAICGSTFESDDTFGNTWIEIVKGVAGKKKFIRLYVWNTPECRLAYQKRTDDIPTQVIRTKRFLKQFTYTPAKSDVIRPLLNIADPLNKKYWMQEGTSLRTVLFLKNEMAGYTEYGMPTSVSSLVQQLLEYRGPRYNLDNLENNLSPGGLIGLKGNLTGDETDAVSNKVNSQLVGTGKAGRWIALSAEGGFEGLDIKPFDTNRDGSFLEMDKIVESKIILSHQWNKVLAGLDDGSALGKGNTYLKTVYELALKKVIIPRQSFQIDNFILPFFQIVDDWLGTQYSQLDWYFKNESPVSFLSLLKNIDPALQVDEVRKELGLPIDETKKGEYMGKGPIAPADPNNDVPPVDKNKTQE